MKVIEKNTGEKLTVIGTEKSAKDNRLLLVIKGWNSNCFLELTAALTEDGLELNESMFAKSDDAYANVFNGLMWVNGQSN